MNFEIEQCVSGPSVMYFGFHHCRFDTLDGLPEMNSFAFTAAGLSATELIVFCS
jgi:hypothetical protein